MDEKESSRKVSPDFFPKGRKCTMSINFGVPDAPSETQAAVIATNVKAGSKSAEADDPSTKPTKEVGVVVCADPSTSKPTKEVGVVVCPDPSTSKPTKQVGVVISADPNNVIKCADVPLFGTVIKKTRFICFQPPYQNVDENSGNPSVKGLMRHILGLHRNLGMVIDLTDTYKFYNPHTFESVLVKHRKVYCTDKAELPQKALLDQFYAFVDDYAAQTANSLDSNAEKFLIGVHCTTGIQKTAYFVCKYMVDRLEFSVEGAIEAFEKARGCSLEDDVYMKELRSKKTISPAQPLKSQNLKTQTLVSQLSQLPACTEHEEVTLHSPSLKFEEEPEPKPKSPKGEKQKMKTKKKKGTQSQKNTKKSKPKSKSKTTKSKKCAPVKKISTTKSASSTPIISPIPKSLTPENVTPKSNLITKHPKKKNKHKLKKK